MIRRWSVGAVAVVGVWVAQAVLAAPPASEEANARDVAKAAFEEGLHHEEKREYPKAMEAYQRALAINRRQPEVLSHLGSCYREAHDYRNAIAYYREALRFNSNLVNERVWLGEVYAKTGQVELAQTQYEKLKALDEEKAKELQALIDAAATGSTEEAPEPPAAPPTPAHPTRPRRPVTR